MLVFVGVPVVAVLVIAGVAYAASGRGVGGGGKRYRPGRPFDFTPVWFVSGPEELADSAGTALAVGVQVSALSGRGQEQAGQRVSVGETGGASDRW
ncbi:aa3-type cytochrome oxidase subunit CtaJ [Salinispora mooreana]|uniref:aa3-type cytochrome oxidase subunit CtaJ n=1 Tax=Salinispora mooreana TaxID=999545 RepID=UPI0003770A0F|nr:hypothetical protein [Salinispora mooreana]